MTLKERIEATEKFLDSASNMEWIILSNQIAIMESLIRIESKFHKEAPFFQEQLNEPAKWEHNKDGSITI